MPIPRDHDPNQLIGVYISGTKRPPLPPEPKPDGRNGDALRFPYDPEKVAAALARLDEEEAAEWRRRAKRGKR